MGGGGGVALDCATKTLLIPPTVTTITTLSTTLSTTTISTVTPITPGLKTAARRQTRLAEIPLCHRRRRLL